MTPQTNGMPELKYSEETFRGMYKALKEIKDLEEPYLHLTTFGKELIDKALAKAEGK